ncbi:hypothetical protein NQD34_017789 [Periophthalmus magnuspinnatus]|nr:hypothetical protein NQD34_017789 [Periophthalmus magnuspinnatus]
MATGSGWQQQPFYSPAAGQGKFTTSTSTTSLSFQSGITMEYTQDLHLKMSKKIAQLTKVRLEFDHCSLISVPKPNRI